MKSIFEKNIREAVIERINLLHEDSDALWGKMTVTQLLSISEMLGQGFRSHWANYFASHWGTFRLQ